MEEHINVSLSYGERVLDLRLPRHIEVRQLIRELDSILGTSQSRRKYQLRVITKGLILDEGKWLHNYPVTTGDIITMEDI